MEMHGLTDDIVFEIMEWLPADSLMRFRCVSKAWNTMIRCDPTFIKSHIARSQSRPSATHLLFELQNRLEWSRPLEGPSLRLVPHNYFNPREIIICSNHCNGLVCLHSYKDTQNYLYNVTTGEMKAFPFSRSCQHDSEDPEFFLGFDQATERYKLLHYCWHSPTGTDPMKILTLGTNSWRSVGCTDYYPSESVFVNGVIYWTNWDGAIEYFNFTDEKFGTLLPPESSYFSGLNKMQTALSGKLVVHYWNFEHEEPKMVYHDDDNKVIMKFNSDFEKVPMLEVEGIDDRKDACVVLATTSIVNAPTSLEFPLQYFPLRYVSSFVENIIPLKFLLDA